MELSKNFEHKPLKRNGTSIGWIKNISTVNLMTGNLIPL